MSNKRDRVYIAREDKPLYERLHKEAMGKGKGNKELFLLAVATGSRCGVPRPFEKREEYVRAEYFNERDLALLSALAVQHEKGNIDIVSNRDEVFAIAEQYAHAGIRLLAEMIDSSSHEGFEKRFEKDLHEAFAGIPQQE